MPGEEVVIQAYGDPAQNQIMVRLPLMQGVEQGASLEQGAKRVVEAVKAANLGQFEVVQQELVGPVVGADLQRKGIYATLASILGITIYIALRFRLSFAVGAMAATLHDILVTLAFLVFFKYELSLNVIAAILAITGYSVNDTIVIFDRVRENSHLLRRESLEKIVNDSVNQTLSRTIITAGTTFLAVLSLYLFGGEVLHGFAFTMLVGIISGTYSTIFIAAAVAIILSKAAAGPHGAGRGADPRGRQGATQGQGFVSLPDGGDPRHRAGDHRVSADLELGPPDPGPRALRVGFRRTRARLRRGHPSGHAGGGRHLLLGRPAPHDPRPARGPLPPRTTDPAARMVRLVVIGTIPVVIAGLLFADAIEEHLRKPLVTVITLTIGGIFFLIVERLGPRTRTENDLTWLDSLAFGLGAGAGD